MKYRIAAAALLLYASAFLQAAPLSVLRPFGVAMMLPLALTVVTGLLRGPFESILMGFLYGLSADMLLGRTLGLHALLYAGVAGLLTLVNEKLYREKLLIQFAFSFTAAVITETLFFVFWFLLRGYDAFGTMFLRNILPMAVCNGLLVLPLYRPVARVYAWLDAVDRKRNRIGGNA